MVHQIAALAYEAWRASGARTLARLSSLVDFYTTSYYGPSRHAEILSIVGEAERLVRAKVQPWQIQN